MDVLALNPGSSSLRFQVVRLDGSGDAAVITKLGGGSIAPIGPERGAQARDHAEAFDLALEWIEARGLSFQAVGVRLVHIGGELGEARIADTGFLEGIRGIAGLAPLHTEPALEAIEHFRTRLDADLPVVVVSDSAFHATMPAVAREYALPRRWTEELGIRRFGYHGLAVASVVESFSAGSSAASRIIVAHLGGGCSVTAVREGRSIDTSMGFSPLGGLVMGTRSGDVDPSVVARVCRELGITPDEVVDRLNRGSGLLGVSGASRDMRDIERLRSAGDEAAARAFDLFAYRARSHVAASMAALGGCDALLFSGGIGENSPGVRAAVLLGMEWCGMEIDPARNLQPETFRGRVSADGSRVAVHVVPADEERSIARATQALLSRAVKER
jgi:acetate kinase